MSIASEITRLYGVRDNIFTSITNKGVTVPSNSKLDDVPTLVGSIPSGGGGTANAFTLDYVNPNQYCTFNSNNPDCSRPNAIITPQYALTNNYVLDNLTLNGTNIQGSSFTMPSTDSVVGMVVHQITPLILKFNTSKQASGGFVLRQLQVNNSTPNIIGAYKEYSWGVTEDYRSEDIASLNSGGDLYLSMDNTTVYILMNAVFTDTVSFTCIGGYGGPLPTEITYGDQVIHSANISIDSHSVTYVNLVPQS